ncbi:MAG: SDR family NAD(P)-dependent oxidoreductase, partial [Verrucomicrobiota bacterium]
MELGLKGQRAFVLGGAQGIGRAIAESFCDEGCEVGVFDRDPQVGSLSKELSAITKTFCGDISDYGEVQAAAEAFGPVNHVVYAIGIGSGKFG